MKIFSGRKFKLYLIQTDDGPLEWQLPGIKRKGGYNRKKNHVLNRIEKQWLRKSEIEYFNKLRKKQKHRRKANGI